MHTPYKEAVACLNGLLLLAVTVLSITNYQLGNKRKSWATAFHVLCVIWLCFRQIFWYLTLVSHGTWSATEFYLVYWFPHPIQVDTYIHTIWRFDLTQTHNLVIYFASLYTVCDVFASPFILCEGAL